MISYYMDNDRYFDLYVYIGMSTAALLSKAGMKVLVLEKHYKCGGVT